jgi:hypothetical protein
VERRRFLRHLPLCWDVHRHRIAPGSAAIIHDLESRDRLQIRAGRFAGRCCAMADAALADDPGEVFAGPWDAAPRRPGVARRP